MAVRLQRWFRSGVFKYSLEAPNPPAGDGSSDAIADFLAQKKGYCVHFASAMAVMARILNIPARVAVGFLPGDLQTDDRWSVKANDAHAWPELYFEGVGWTRFEPTPRSDGLKPPEWSNPSTGVVPDDPAATAEPEDTAAAAPDEPGATKAPKQTDETATAKTASTDGQSVPWRAIAIVLVVLFGVALPRLVASAASRRRWNRATSMPALAEAAWDDLRLGLSDLGVQWAASWTPHAVKQRLLNDYEFDPEQQAALDRLTGEIENARYAPPSDELGRTAGERAADVSAVVSAVSTLLPGQIRWRARLWPPSGVAAIISLGAWLSSASERAGRWTTGVGDQVRSKVSKTETSSGDAAGNVGDWDRGGRDGAGQDDSGREKVGSGQP